MKGDILWKERKDLVSILCQQKGIDVKIKKKKRGKKEMKKRLNKMFLFLATVFAMMLSFVPANVFAAANEIIVDGSGSYTLDYEGLSGAIRDVADNGIVKLGGDIDCQSSTCTISKPFVLDLNGKKISYQPSGAAGGSLFLIPSSSNANMTIKDSGSTGVIEASGKNSSVIAYGGTGVLTLESGTLKNLSETAITMYAGIFQMNGGKIEALDLGLENRKSGIVNIAGGVVEVSDKKGKAIFLTSSGTTSITGGTIRATGGGSAIDVDPGNAGQINISGTALITSNNASTGTITQISRSKRLTITGGTVSNTASPEGYSIYRQGTNGEEFNITGGTVGRIGPAYIISGYINDGGKKPVQGVLPGLPATLQLKKGTNNVGNPVTANAENGAFKIYDVLPDNAYTIEVSMPGYEKGTITSFVMPSNDIQNKNLALLPEKDKVDKAKPLAESAIVGITATNSTTAGNILDAVKTGISSVTGVTAAWKAGSPIIIPATEDKDGSITGTIVLTCGSTSAEIAVNKTIKKTKDENIFTSGNCRYKVTSDKKDGTGTVKMEGLAKGKSVSKLSVGKTVTWQGVSYRITAVGDRAFYNNKKIKEVNIGNNVTTIGKDAFKGCSKLTTVVLGNKVSELKSAAFYKCTSLKKVTIGTGLKKMGSHMFCHDKKLTSLTIKSKKLTKIGKHNLYGSTKLKIKVPSSKVKAYTKLFKGQGQKKSVKITK